MTVDDNKEELKEIKNKLDEILEKTNKLATISQLEEIKNEFHEMERKANHDYWYMVGLTIMLASIPISYIGALKEYVLSIVPLIVVGLALIVYSLYRNLTL